jgi:methyl-accepting chemotaxis protein
MQEISGILGQQTEAADEISRNITDVARNAVQSEGRLKNMSDKLRACNDHIAGEAAGWLNADDPRSLCEMAKIDHILFKKRIADTISGYSAWHAAEVPDHHGCRLGKWYDNIAGPEVRSRPAFAALVEPHRRVHAAGRVALEAYQRGNMSGAVQAIEELNAASMEVLHLLGVLSSSLDTRQTSKAA